MKSTSKRTGFLIGFAVLIAVTISGTAHANAKTQQSTNFSSGFAVDFTDCVESIGVTLVSTASARVHVPNQFVLAGEGQPVTPWWFAPRCGIGVDGHGGGKVDRPDQRCDRHRTSPETSTTTPSGTTPVIYGSRWAAPVRC